MNRGPTPPTKAKTLTSTLEDPESPEGLWNFLLDVPNTVTLAGLAAGLGAVGLVAQSRYAPALAAALIAILIDQVDGRLALARPQRSAAVAAFGAHLDCYADLVSKGLFPALMLLTLGDFSPGYWAIGGLHLGAIAVRYSYEFVPGARRRGISPDYSVVSFALLFLAEPRLGDHYSTVLASTMLLMAGLNLAPFSSPKLSGSALVAFMVILVGLAALLLGGY